jgi:hypothetical protein
MVQAVRGAPVTARALHAIPLGKLIEKRRPKPGAVTLAIDNATHAHTAEKLSLTTPSRRRRGGRPPKYPPEHWQAVARIYTEAYLGNRTPTRAVAKHFKVKESAAAKWVAKCRNDLGLLPKTTRGKATVNAVVSPATIRAVASIPTPTVRATGGGTTKPDPKKTKRTRRGGSR